MNPVRVFDRRQLILLLWGLLTAGFVAVSVIGYEVSRRGIRDTLIAQEIDRACEQLCEHGVTRRMSEEAMRRRLETFAARIAADARSAALLSVRLV